MLKRADFPGVEWGGGKKAKSARNIRELTSEYGWKHRMTEPAVEEEETMGKKPKVTLPGKVEKIIKPIANDGEKAQISLEDGDELYREVRIENTLNDEKGEKVRLKENAKVDVTVEADPADTTPK